MSPKAPADPAIISATIIALLLGAGLALGQLLAQTSSREVGFDNEEPPWEPETNPIAEMFTTVPSSQDGHYQPPTVYSELLNDTKFEIDFIKDFTRLFPQYSSMMDSLIADDDGQQSNTTRKRVKRQVQMEQPQQDTATKYMNVCMESSNHKPDPGPEPELHGQCKLWAENACCTEKTTELIHSDPQLSFHGFNFSHCQPISPQCLRFFRQEMCFFACSPNLGPFIEQPQPHKGGHFHQVPLCAADCHAWFNACANDLTCVADWFNHFDWTTGTNVCPPDSTCRTFKNVFKDAKSFCEKVWGGEWLYENQSTYCLKLFFEPSNNPNVKAAAFHAGRRARSDADNAILAGSGMNDNMEPKMEVWGHQGGHGGGHLLKGSSLALVIGVLGGVVVTGMFGL